MFKNYINKMTWQSLQFGTNSFFSIIIIIKERVIYLDNLSLHFFTVKFDLRLKRFANPAKLFYL